MVSAIIYHLFVVDMADSLDNVELNTADDYRFFAYIIGDKLRNPNFKAQKRQIFLKALLEQVKPFCSFKCYEKIEKSINEISQQKEADYKLAKKIKEGESNKIKKNLVDVKMGRMDDYYDDYSDDDDYDDYEDEGKRYMAKNK